MKINCSHCGNQYEVEDRYMGQTLKCPDCGNEITVNNPKLAPCPDCLTLISKRARTCPHCGAPLIEPEKNEIRSTANFAIHEDLSEEKEIMVCHPSVMNYLVGILLGLLTCVILIGFLILLYVWINIHYTSYRITTQRIIVRQGWIAKYQNEIWIKDMRGANLVQGIWQRIIGVGDISIGTAATAGAEICMKGIANPQKVVDQINKLRR